jgi:hypothetical protein
MAKSTQGTKGTTDRRQADESSSEARDKLLKQLRSLIKEIDEEGLQFLIEQANVLIYNAKVEELNARREEVAREQRNAAQSSKGRSAKAKKETAEAGSQVYFEPGKHSGGFLMDIDGNRFVMDQEEVMSLVGIAQKAPSRIEAHRRLYRWIEGNRDDILLDVDLPPAGTRMQALYERLRSDFRIRK